MNKNFPITLFLIITLFSGCSTRGQRAYKPHVEQQHVESPKTTLPSPPSTSKAYVDPKMKPYVVNGVRYHPTDVSVGDVFKGNASWYGPDFHGKLTSNGERYNMWAMTAAHKTLPMNTTVKVTNLRNNMSVVVRITDRGPFVSTRIIDLSKAAANSINMIGHGTAPVRLDILGFQSKGETSIPPYGELKKSSQEEKIGNYALQIGSFSKIEGALKIQEKYDNTSGYKTVIVDAQTSEARMFKVLLKGFKSEREARDYKENGIFENAFIVKEDSNDK